MECGHRYGGQKDPDDQYECSALHSTGYYDVAVTRLHRRYDEIMTAQGPASSEKSDSPLMY